MLILCVTKSNFHFSPRHTFDALKCNNFVNTCTLISQYNGPVSSGTLANTADFSGADGFQYISDLVLTATLARTVTLTLMATLFYDQSYPHSNGLLAIILLATALLFPKICK